MGKKLLLYHFNGYIFASNKIWHTWALPPPPVALPSVFHLWFHVATWCMSPWHHDKVNLQMPHHLKFRKIEFFSRWRPWHLTYDLQIIQDMVKVHTFNPWHRRGKYYHSSLLRNENNLGHYPYQRVTECIYTSAIILGSHCVHQIKTY